MSSAVSIPDKNFKALESFYDSYQKKVKSSNSRYVLIVEKDEKGKKHLSALIKRDLSCFRKIQMWFGCGYFSLKKVVKYVNNHKSDFHINNKSILYSKELQKRIDRHNDGEDSDSSCAEWRKVDDIARELRIPSAGSADPTISSTPPPPALTLPPLPTINPALNCVLKKEKENTILKVGDCELVLCPDNDITKYPTDVIVNAANEGMLGGGGVDGKITEAGKEILDFFRRLVPVIPKVGRCPEGETRLTDAGALPAAICAHTVGPAFRENKHKEHRELLINAYQNTFKAVHDFFTYLSEDKQASDDPRRPILVDAKYVNALKNDVKSTHDAALKSIDEAAPKELASLEKKLNAAKKNKDKKNIQKEIDELPKKVKERKERAEKEYLLYTSDKLLKAAQASQEGHEKDLKGKIKKGEVLSISFPTIATGIFDYPKDEGAIIALTAALEYSHANQGKLGIKRIQFLFISKQKDVPYYNKFIKEIYEAWEKASKA